MKGQLILIKEPLLYKIPRVERILNKSYQQIFDLFKTGELKAHNDAPGRIGRKGYSVVVSSLKAYRPDLFQPDFILHPSPYLPKPFPNTTWSDPSKPHGGFFPGLRVPERFTRLKRTVILRILEVNDNKFFVRPEDLLLPKAADTLNVSPKQIYRLIKENKLSGIKFAKHDMYIPYSRLIHYVEKYTLTEEDCLNLP